MTTSTIDAIFDLMDDWRHLPAYQLERRADVFFAAYLPTFIANRNGATFNPLIVPEFPVRLGAIVGGSTSNQSYKIDYFALTKDRSAAWLIELKTDSGSRRDRQDAYLQLARDIGLRSLLAGLLEIVRATSAKHKYCCLLRLLERLSLLRLPTEIDAALDSVHWNTGVNRYLPDIEITAPEVDLGILYLQPRSHGDDEVGFDEFASWLERRGDDPVALRFAQSLRQWAKVTPGRPVCSN